MKHNIPACSMLVIATATQLVACAVTNAEVDQAASERQAFINKAARSVTSDVPTRPQPVTRIAGNYLGGHVLPLSKSLALPATSHDVVLNCGPGARGSLDDVAQVVRKFTGMPVRRFRQTSRTQIVVAFRP